MKTILFFAMALAFFNSSVRAQILSPTGNRPPVKPEDTEVYEPVPGVVKAGKSFDIPPSDAIILFDGKNLDEWESARDKSAATWKVEDGIFTVDKRAGDIQTKKTFTNYHYILSFVFLPILRAAARRVVIAEYSWPLLMAKQVVTKYKCWTVITMKIKPT